MPLALDPADDPPQLWGGEGGGRSRSLKWPEAPSQLAPSVPETYPDQLDDAALGAIWPVVWLLLCGSAPARLHVELIARAGEAAIALWLHDAICDLQASSNGLNSAAWVPELRRPEARAHVLRRRLDRPRLHGGEQVVALLEVQGRINLAAAPGRIGQ